MNARLTFSQLVVSLLFSLCLFACQPILPSPDETEEKEFPADFLFRQRAFPQGTIDRQAWKTAIAQAAEMRRQAEQNQRGVDWELAGPTNVGGRISTLAVEPGNTQVMYAGAASGGIWKTTDEGLNWTPVFDGAPTLSIGDIGLALSQPQTLYVGTGEANGGGGSVAYDGYGMFKSNDGGANWQHLGLEETGCIGKIAVHPTDPEQVFVAAVGHLFSNNSERGVFRTLDGGQSWAKVLFVNDSTGAVDLAFHPTDFNIIYATTWQRIRRPDRRQYGGPGCGIWRSTDGGDTWQKLTSGLPDSDNGRIGLAVSLDEPDWVYAIYDDEAGFFKGVFKSNDTGDAWEQVNVNGDISHASFGWWFGKIYADPSDAGRLFALGVDLHLSENGGQEFIDIQPLEVHVDHHALWINPFDPSHLVLGNDGGLYVSHDGAVSWEFRSNIPITQFYACEMDFQQPERIYGGTQDNGTWRTISGQTDDWQFIYGGDGFQARVNPQNNQFVYAEYQYGALAVSDNGGSSFDFVGNQITGRKNWNMPVHLDPNDPNIVYAGSEQLWRSLDNGYNWQSASPDLSNGLTGGNLVYASIYSIAVSPKNSEIIWAGTDDGNVQVTSNGGNSWEEVSDDLPKRWVTRVEASPHDEQAAYVTFSGYRYGEYLPHVFKTTNLGATWEDISGNLPEAPVNDLIADPTYPGRLWVATDVGVYFTENEGLSWQMLGTALPNVIVTDLSYHPGERKLVAATFGRSMYWVVVEDLVADREPVRQAAGLSVSPNPLRSSGQVELRMDRRQAVEVSVCDLQGRQLFLLEKGMLEAGLHRFTLTVERLPVAGVYFVRASGQDFQAVERVVVIK